MHRPRPGVADGAVTLVGQLCTPKDVLERLNAVVVKALDDPMVTRRLTDLGLEIPSGELRTPEGVRAFLKSEIDTWWPVIKAANIKAE